MARMLGSWARPWTANLCLVRYAEDGTRAHGVDKRWCGTHFRRGGRAGESVMSVEKG